MADALEIAKHADASLYIVRQGYTRKPMLDGVNEKYTRGEIKNVSMVMNYFKDKGTYGYGYGYGYGAYGNGYHENDIKKSRFAKLTEMLKSFLKRKS